MQCDGVRVGFMFEGCGEVFADGSHEACCYVAAVRDGADVPV